MPRDVAALFAPPFLLILIAQSAIRADEKAPDAARASAAGTATPAEPSLNVAELAEQLSDLSADDTELVRRYLQLSEPLPADVDDRNKGLVERTKLKESIPAAIAELSERLLNLTLAEAGKLGARLEEHHDGRHSEFALDVFLRQRRALEAIKAVQQRLVSGGDGQPYIDNPLTVRPVTPNWNSPALKPEHWQEVIRVSLARNYWEYGGLPGTDVSDADLEHVAMLASLEDLDLHDSQVADAGLASIARLGRLQILMLRDAKKITDAGIAQLSRLTQLRKIDLEGTDLTGSGLAALQTCRHLSSLKISGESVDQQALSAVAGMPNLVELVLKAPLLADASVPVLPKLEVFTLSTPAASRAKVHDLPSLLELTLSAGGAEEISLGSLPRLEHLVIGRTSAAGCRLRLADLPQLDQFELQNDRRCDIQSYSDIGKITNLRTLEVTSPLTDDDVAQLAGLRQLETLRLPGHRQPNRLTVKGFRSLGELKELRSLHVVNDGVTDACVQALGDLLQLRQLQLPQFSGSGDGPQALGKLPHLEELGFFRGQIDHLDLSAFPALERFHIAHVVVRDFRLVGMQKLKHLDGANIRIQTLDLQDAPVLEWLSLSMLDAEKIEQLTLRKLPRLSTLRLIGVSASGSVDGGPLPTNITDDVIRYAAEMPHLQSIDLNHSKITDQGLEYLAPCKEITSLDLSRSQITDAGLVHLHGMPKLIFFSTAETGVSYNGLVQLKKVIPSLHVPKSAD